MKTTMKTDVSLVCLLCLLSLCPADASGRHSLTYIYTALSRPTELDGIHEFTAMGLVDGKMIDYFDSDLREKVPKQQWMKDNMDKSYWDKGTKSRLSKQAWFQVNMGILKERLRQNDSETHVLQWQHGCEGVTVDGSVRFSSGRDTYSYDGRDFLHFDDHHGVWVSSTAAAEDTKKKWDTVKTLKDYTKGYLENECLSWLKTFVEHEEKQLQAASPPKLFMFTKSSVRENTVILTCMATELLQQVFSLEMRRDGRLLGRMDGVESSGVRPNNGDTYQRRDSVEILKTDESLFTCEVIHEESKLRVMETWDHSLPESESILSVWALVAVVLVLVLVLGVVGVLVLAKFFLCREKFSCASKKERTITIEGKPLNKETEECDSLGSGSSADSGVSDCAKKSSSNTLLEKEDR